MLSGFLFYLQILFKLNFKVIRCYLSDKSPASVFFISNDLYLKDSYSASKDIIKDSAIIIQVDNYSLTEGNYISSNTKWLQELILPKTMSLLRIPECF